ncbi:MAG TPA: hypothetical protein VN762_12450 [Steroidobacteraceae bacterium]|nr:hypothetical protein [Steroidobacteraceae bacterium]
MYGEKSHGSSAQQKTSWWSASDRWIPPQQLNWTRPLLARLRLAKRPTFSPSPWLRVS